MSELLEPLSELLKKRENGIMLMTLPLPMALIAAENLNLQDNHPNEKNHEEFSSDSVGCHLVIGIFRNLRTTVDEQYSK